MEKNVTRDASALRRLTTYLYSWKVAGPTTRGAAIPAKIPIRFAVVLIDALAKLRDPGFRHGKSWNKLAHNLSVSHAQLFQLLAIRLFSDRPTHDVRLFPAEDMPTLATIIRGMHAPLQGAPAAWHAAILVVEATCRRFLHRCAWAVHHPDRNVGVSMLEMADVCLLFLRRPDATLPFERINAATARRLARLLRKPQEPVDEPVEESTTKETTSAIAI